MVMKPNIENYKFIRHIFIRSCDNMLHLLQKGKDFIKEKSLSEQEILDAKLAEDMYNFKKQVQIFSDNALGAIYRGASLEKPKMADDENYFDELVIRIEKTKELILNIDIEKLENIKNFEELKIKLPWMPSGTYFDAETYFGHFVVQNTLFHLVTAYNILRHKGVQIGKQDFLGPIEMKTE